MYQKHDTLVLIGAGGHAKVCYEIAQLLGIWKDFIILDDNPVNTFFKIAGSISEYTKYLDIADFFVAIGANEVRAQIIQDMQKKEYNLITLIHPHAIISSSADIAQGTVVMPGAIVNVSSKIGNGVILNTGCTIDHDNVIEDYVHVSPGVHLSGNVHVGKNTWIGTGSSIINNILIFENVIVGAGSNVVNNITKSGVYYGNPVKENTIR